METKKAPVLTGKRASYAVGAAAIADIVASFLAPEYIGLFGRLATLLTGGN